MKLLFAILAICVGIAATTRAEVQNYPWCSYYTSGGGGTNCGFHDIPAVPRQYARDWRRNTQYQPPPGPHLLPKVQSRYPS